MSNYIEEEPINDKKVLVVNGFREAAGLNHQISNLKVLIKFARKLGAKLLVPQFLLWGFHDCRRDTRATQFQECLDFDKMGVIDELFFSAKDIPPGHVMLFLNCVRRPPDGLFRKIPEVAAAINNGVPPHPEDVKIVWNIKFHNIASTITDTGFDCIVHVRRTDKITTDLWDECTSPDHIHTVVKNVLPQGGGVYIMSDEKWEFFEPLKNEDPDNYKYKTYHDFPDLIKIKDVDNYTLFIVEQCMQLQIKKRISTENMLFDNFYQDYLVHKKPTV